MARQCPHSHVSQLSGPGWFCLDSSGVLCQVKVTGLPACGVLGWACPHIGTSPSDLQTWARQHHSGWVAPFAPLLPLPLIHLLRPGG